MHSRNFWACAKLGGFSLRGSSRSMPLLSRARRFFSSEASCCMRLCASAKERELARLLRQNCSAASSPLAMAQ
eukprot:CAMPEP_0180792660 /NCGR_PEP_ID=MMETSP1038_2-20121128/54538_1 /TAXON_ID=632150 /ORGANISM="Azadinium spinosum, Strain 3D9" /LENGTH=72 /DNA_ID=CAMNT_0022831035 /DNA_START=79 /DNA_END=294 /DNA_ORIENTATION=+